MSGTGVQRHRPSDVVEASLARFLLIGPDDQTVPDWMTPCVTHGVTHGGLNKHLKSSGFWKEIKDDMSLSHSFSPSLSLSLSQNLSLSLSHTHTHTLTYSLTHPYVYTLFLVEHTPTYFHYCYTYNTSYLDDPAYQLSTNF